ncbi:hypothetical protein RQP46_002955 [Phenoliferia psychrophenolica]
MAIYGGCGDCSFIAVRNIQVNGQRPALGYLGNGVGLLEMGGTVNGQIIDNCHIYEPRGWTALHGIEGTNLACQNMTISNNQVGPSGNSPNTGLQFRGKRDTTVFAPGQWADGISLACKESEVYGNVVTDATDGGIVIFQAPGSHIHDNTIIASTRVLLGGINAVDWGPFGGGYTGTVVERNTIIAQSTMIKIGMALGGMSWGSYNVSTARTFDGLFQDNTFTSGPSGYFGYAISVAGHDRATVLNNDATTANFGGGPSIACIPIPLVPTSQAFVYDEYTTSDHLLQSNFVNKPLVFLICQQPGSILSTGPRIHPPGRIKRIHPPRRTSLLGPRRPRAGRGGFRRKPVLSGCGFIDDNQLLNRPLLIKLGPLELIVACELCGLVQCATLLGLACLCHIARIELRASIELRTGVELLAATLILLDPPSELLSPRQLFHHRARTPSRILYLHHSCLKHEFTSIDHSPLELPPRKLLAPPCQFFYPSLFLRFFLVYETLLLGHFLLPFLGSPLRVDFCRSGGSSSFRHRHPIFDQGLLPPQVLELVSFEVLLREPVSVHPRRGCGFPLESNFHSTCLCTLFGLCLRGKDVHSPGTKRPVYKASSSTKSAAVATAAPKTGIAAIVQAVSLALAAAVDSQTKTVAVVTNPKNIVQLDRVQLNRVSKTVSTAHSRVTPSIPVMMNPFALAAQQNAITA